MNKDTFLLSNRNVGLLSGAMSIAITWVWAPALFLSAKLAYDWGIVGFTWFIVPNFLTLMLFAYFANQLRIKNPLGTTLHQFMADRYSRRVSRLYLIELLLLSFCAAGVQVLAGGKIISSLLDVNFTFVTVCLALVPLIYSFIGGFQASVITDKIQYILILISLIIIIPIVFYLSGGFSVNDIHGISGNYTHFFSGPGATVSLSYGIPIMIGLLAGAFGSQEYWQRGYSLQESKVIPTFLLSGVLFAIIPISIGMLGFIAVSNNMVVTDSFLVNVEVIKLFGGQYLMIPFIIMIICGLISTIDSSFSSAASLIAFDKGEDTYLRSSRIIMIVYFIAIILLANIPGIQVLHFFVIYGMIRAAVLIPTLIGVGTKWIIKEYTVFYGILISLCLGVPIFAISQLYNMSTISLLCSLFVVFFPAIFMITSKVTK